MGRRSEQTVSQRRHTGDPWAQKRCSASPVIREMQTSHLLKWLLPKSQEIASVGEDLGKGEPSCPAGGNGNWGGHYGKQRGGSRINKTRTTMWPSYPRRGIRVKNAKTRIQKDKCTPVFTAASFKTAKTWKQPIPGWMGAEAGAPAHNGTLVGQEKAGDAAIWNDRGWPQRYCAEWIQSDHGR